MKTKTYEEWRSYIRKQTEPTPTQSLITAKRLQFKLIKKKCKKKIKDQTGTWNCKYNSTIGYCKINNCPKIKTNVQK